MGGWLVCALGLLSAPAHGRPLDYPGLNLHNHTYCSDGRDSPERLIRKARSAGIRHLAITDHDSVACLERGRAAAERLGIRFIAGIEVSAEDGSLHILGLNIIPTHPAIRYLAGHGRKAGADQARAAAAKLSGQGCPMGFRDVLVQKLSWKSKADRLPPLTAKELGRRSEEDLLSLLGDATITLPDVGWAAAGKGCARNMLEAFETSLGERGTAYVPLGGPSFREAIDKIHEAGGIAVLAHPITLLELYKWPRRYSGRKYRDFDALASDLLRSGLDGFEQYKQPFGPDPEVLRVVRRFEKQSLRRILLTPGSDYHGGPKDMGPSRLSAIPIPWSEASLILNTFAFRKPKSRGE